MRYYLELQASMEKVQPFRTIDIHASSQHFLGERLLWSQIRGRHGKMRKCDLDMKRHGDSMADHDKPKSVPSTFDRFVDHGVSKPVPEHTHSEKLEITMPCGSTLLWSQPTNKML